MALGRVGAHVRAAQRPGRGVVAGRRCPVTGRRARNLLSERSGRSAVLAGPNAAPTISMLRRERRLVARPAESTKQPVRDRMRSDDRLAYLAGEASLRQPAPRRDLAWLACGEILPGHVRQPTGVGILATSCDLHRSARRLDSPAAAGAPAQLDPDDALQARACGADPGSDQRDVGRLSPACWPDVDFEQRLSMCAAPTTRPY
jgi:hypothetical protein